MSNIYLTSDLHFCHGNSIRFTNRPFQSIKEMNETLIENWNKTVSQKDKVYVLGDFSFGGSQETSSIFNRLNGSEKFLIKGNHDNQNTCKLRWGWVKDTYGLKWEGNYIWLSHYPHVSWNRSYHGSQHLFGHVHSQGNWWSYKNSCDVGVDYWNYHPVSIEEVLSHLKQINITASRHIRGRYYLWKGRVDSKEFEFHEIPLTRSVSHTSSPPEEDA